MFVKFKQFKHPHFRHSMPVLLDDENKIWFLLRSVLLNLDFVDDHLVTFNNFTKDARLVKLDEIKDLMCKPKNLDCIDGYYFIDADKVREYIKKSFRIVDSSMRNQHFFAGWFEDILTDTDNNPNERIQPSAIVRHFKGGYYYVIRTDVYWHEGDMRLVVYKSLCDGKIYARPYDMFCSKVNHVKYSEVEQVYRFEVVEMPCA